MPDFGRTSRDDDASLDAVLRSDRLIEALATGAPVPAQDQADATLAALLGGWRDEMRWPPSTGLVSEQDAVAALRSGLAEKQTTGRSRRGLSVVGAAAAAVLCIGGFGAVVAGSGPGDALYGLRSMLFGAPKQVRNDQVALAAQTELNQVQDLIARGDWQGAQDKLVAVSNQVAAVGDADQKQQLFDQWNQLSAKVVERDPEATVPPGITYTVPPTLTELVATPAATTVPNTPIPPITVSTTSVPTSPGSPSTSPSEVTSPPTSASTSPAEQTAPSSTTAPEPTTTAPTTTPSPSPSATTTTVPTTTTTTPPPVTTTTPPPVTTTTPPPVTTTTAAVAPAAPSTVVSTTAAIQQTAASVAPSTAASVPPSSPVEVKTSPPAPVTVDTPSVVPTKQAPPVVITTTAAVPVPVPAAGAGG